MQNFIDETAGTVMKAICCDDYPQLEVTYGGPNAGRPAERIDVEAFIGVKSHRAKGKRVTTFVVDRVAFVEPLDKGPHEPSEDMDESEEEFTPETVSDGTLPPHADQRESSAAATVSKPVQPVQPAPKSGQSQKGYVAGESVEFDIASEEGEQPDGTSQMELF